MEKSEETEAKESSGNGKDEQLSILDTNVQKSPAKKKFYNTVFATKMRNRRKEEKLKEIDSTEVLTNCKGMSVDMTHINSEAVLKLITAVEQKHRKRKRHNRWKLGLTTKKKKPIDKGTRVDKVNKECVSDRSVSVSVTSEGKIDSLAKEEKAEKNNLESSDTKDNVQRRKSLRHIESNAIPEQNNSEIQSNQETIFKEEIFSCRRTEPFIGKLKTREARILNIENILKGSGGSVSQNNNEPIENENKDLPGKHEEKRTESVSEANCSEKGSKNNENKELESVRHEKSTTKREKNKNKHNKHKNRNTIDIADTDKNLVNQVSKKSSNKVNETKENVDEETSCRRTIPFEGKTIRKPPSGISEKSIDIATPNDVNTNLDSMKENVNTEPSSSSIDSNTQQNSSNVDHMKSKASNNAKVMSDSNSTSDDAKLKSSKDTDMSDAKSKSESSQVQIAEMDSSTKDVNIIPNSLNKTSTKLDNTTEDQSMEVVEEAVSVKVNKSLNSSNENEININVSNNMNMKLDKLPDDTDSQCTESQITDREGWSCSRTEPFVGKHYSHCSRTLPYIRPVNKVKVANEPETNSDLITDKNIQPDSISNRHVLNEADKSSSDINIPRNSESGSIDCIVNTTMNLDNSSETVVQNGEWKFRRKRQKSKDTEDENQIEEETHPSKKSKIKSSPAKTPTDRKLTATPVSPDRTICSLLSLNCTKHDHHHHTQNGERSIPLKDEKEAYVLLTRLEHINNPLVVDYLKKTDLTSKIDSGLLSPPKDDSDKLSTSLNDTKLAVSNENKMEKVAKDIPLFNIPVIPDANCNTTAAANTVKPPDEVNQPTEIDSSYNEKLLRPKSRARVRPLNRISTESPNITRTKRNKHPVNYLEELTDSDEDNKSNFLISLRTRSQSRGPTLRERNKHKANQDEDEDDMEVEEFSYIGRKSRSQSRMGFESNHNISNKEKLNESTTAKTRSLSRAAKIVESPNKKIQSSGIVHSVNNEPLTVHQSELSAKLSSIHSELHQQSQALEDAELDKEIEEHSRNYKRLRSQSRGPDADSLKSPSFANTTQLVESNKSDVIEAEEQSRASSLQSPLIVQSLGDGLVTPKSNTKNNIPVSGRMSKVSKRGESVSRTPRNILTTPSQKERESSCSSSRSNTPRSSKRLANDVPMKITRSRSNSETVQSIVKSVTKIVSTQDLKVQLIKLETVCQSFKDYSASEIEVVTRKYIDLLMNSNFTCDTWREPINYHRPSDTDMQQVEQIDNSDCVSSDIETQREDIEETMSVQYIENLAVNSNKEPIIIEEVIEIQNDTSAKKQKEISPNKAKEATPRKVDQQNIPSLTPLESAIATLVDQVEPLEKRDFGVVSTIVLGKEKDKEQIVAQSSVGEADRVNQEQRELTEKDTSKKQNKNTILVNGTTMYTCSLCNKIFVIEDLLKEHITLIHGDKSTSTVSTVTSTTTTKSNEKRTAEVASGPSSSKKPTEKSKKRHRYSESLKCAICLQTFETKELLFEHIITHNELELQAAYKTAMAGKNQDPTCNTIVEPGADLEVNNKKKNKVNRKKSTDSSITSCRSSIDDEELNANEPRATLTRVSVNTPIEHQQIIDLAGNENNAVLEPIHENVCQRPISICPCHAHETTNQDLQIEMVLLCKTCNVIFRRRDCFEVHYRSSPECRLKRTNNEITKVPKLFCSGCPCVLESLMKMREHLEEHAKKNNQGTVTFICNICKVAFFGVGGIFYSHWFNHTKAPNFVASRYSFPKLSVVTVLEDPNVAITTTKSQEGFFYIAEHVCRQCRLPFSSEPELQRHKERPCQPPIPAATRSENHDSNRLQMIKLICDLCKKYYVNKENFDRHCCERNHLKTPPPKFSRLPINSNDQAFICGLCRTVAKSDEEIKEHWKRIHSPIMELYTCKTCNVVPSNDVTNYTYEKFERHCRLIHKSEVITCLVYFVTARYVCNICKFGFESERSMKEHQVIHQKRSTVTNIAAGPSSVPTVVPINQAAPSFWVADQPGPDGGMQMHPIYVQYPNVNGNIHPPIPILQNTVPVNALNPQQMQIQSTLIHAGTLNVTPNIITSEIAAIDANVTPTTSASNTGGNSMLRSILAQSVIDTSQSSASHNSTIETIQIDSRSNSPMSDTTTPAATVTDTTNSETSVNADKTVPTSPAARKKSYMTIVNPDFETMLGTNKNPQSNEISDVSSVQDKDTSSSSGDVTPAIMELVTPQPFEVVLVTDDLSENSNGESSTTKDQPTDQKEKSTESTESSSAKPFLRVRSIAELQKMKIHLCSVCGLSFDSLSAFEQHSQQHEDTNEVGRTTPVQMISPMISQTNKETSSEPHDIILQQMRQKLVALTTNGSSSPNNSDSSTRMSPTVHPSQPRLEQQQQQQNYWFTPSNGIGINTTSSMNNNYNVNLQQQRSQQQTAASRSMNSPVNTIDSYLSPRGLPPPYPGTTNTMTPSRSGTIQLPERNLTDSSTPGSKRPSGAATRIPQQSLPSFEELVEHRQSNTRVSYNCNPTDDSVQNSSLLSNRLQMNASARQQHTLHHMPSQKTYSRGSNEMNYSSMIGNNPPNYQNPGQQRKNVYTCKFYGCTYRSNSLSMLRSHEISHFSSKQTTTSSANQDIQSQSPQQLQRLPQKHVSVIQMPERTRHAVPTSRLPPTNNTEKRLVCRICNFTCTTSAELIQHVTTNHSAPAPNQVCCYVCDYCQTPLIFESEDLLRKHMNSSHNHFCNICNKRYPSKEDLLLHMDVHTRNT